MSHRVRMFTVRTGRRTLVHVELDAGADWGWDFRLHVGRTRIDVRRRAEGYVATDGQNLPGTEIRTFRVPGRQ